MDTTKLLWGDWNPVVRDPIDLLRLTLLVGAAGYAAAGEAAAAAVLAVLGGVTLLARLVNLPRPLDLAVVAAMALQGWGEVLGLFDSVAWFDNMVHVTLPMLTSPVVYVGLARLGVLPHPEDETHLRHYAGIFIVTLALGLAIGAVWEMVEFTSDLLFGTDLSLGNRDTVTDLMFDGTGAVVGAGGLVAWARFGWVSVRRTSPAAGPPA